MLVGADGRIAAVGPEREVPRPRGATAVRLGGAALLPGLVNAHSHLELTALRGLVRDLPFLDWIRLVRAIKDGLDGADFRASARWGVLEGFAAGITTSGDTGSTRQAAAALDELGARGVAYQEVFGPAPESCAASLAQLERDLAALAAHRSERVEIGVSPHAPYTVSGPLLEAVTRLAAGGPGSAGGSRPLKAAMHTAESREEAELVARGRGPFAAHLASRGIAAGPRARSSVAWLEAAGFLALRPLLIHCVTVDQADVAAIARRGATVAHCPWSNAVLGHPRADVAALRRAGIAVGLGTDSVAAGGRLDLFAEARLAALAAPLEPAEMLRLVTADGAAALGVAGAGILAPGAWGDLAAVDLAGPAFVGGDGVEQAVAWGATAADVVLTAVAGRVVYRRGRWPGVRIGAERAAFSRAAARAAALSREARSHGIFGPVRPVQPPAIP